MNKMCHTYTKGGNAEPLSFTKAQVDATRELLARKNEFRMVECGVTDLAPVWNLDETSCRALPTSEDGWMATGGEPRNFASERLKQYTVVLATPAVRGQMLAQLIFQGKGAE